MFLKVRQARLDDLRSDDEFQTASECTLRHSPRSSVYDSASECEARYSPWWDYDKKIDEDVSKEKMVLAVGCPQLPAPEEVLKESPLVPAGKIVHEVIETTHIRVEHSHKMGVKSFVLSSETVRDEKRDGYSTTKEQIEVPVDSYNQKEEMMDEYDELKKELEKAVLRNLESLQECASEKEATGLTGRPSLCTLTRSNNSEKAPPDSQRIQPTKYQLQITSHTSKNVI
ncbi:hypothetical protein WA026_021469 [Henosepilachna vigintioctopunctata]|uniref:Uncharacterized protein n=1 Tax=Henosepilachna vigintioctopunctata TaxID=420089 RepID=A0AAW1UPH9_9CUCU